MRKDDRNAIGDKVRRLRYKLKLSQPALARKCQLIGWNVGRDTIAKIEDRRRWVGDFEVVGLAIALRVKPEVLLPSRQESLKLCRAVKSSH
jgi:transcriptional regulator with XRE-family HTH domain